MPRNLFAGRGFELLRELPKCDTGHEVSKCCWEKKALIDWFAAGLPQTFNLLKKKKRQLSAKHNKAMLNKTRYAEVILEIACVY